MATRSRCRSDSLQRRSIKNSFVSSDPSSSTCTQQVPTIKVTADCSGKDKAVNDYNTCTPIADAFMPQRTSRPSTESGSITTKPDLSHMPTATPTAGPCTTSTPSFPSPQTSTANVPIPKKVYTPTPARGYRFTVDDGGYNSETSSVYTVRPIKHEMYVSGSSSPRRDNPKANGLNEGGKGSLEVPTPKKKPVFDVVAEYHGLKLCRVSDAVPYLLGTRNLLTRLASITEDSLHHTPSVFSFNNISPTSLSSSSTQTYTPLDLSLMAILYSLRDPASARQRTGNWCPQGLTTRNDSLILYEHTASNGPEQASVSLSRFVDMAQTWLSIRNPANVSGDPPNALTSWTDIISKKLRKADVDISKIDTKLYLDLTTVLEGDALERRMGEIAQWSRTGHLDRRYAVWCEHVEAKKRGAPVTQTSVTTTTAGSNQTPTRTDGLYSKRFTHKPLISEDEKGERRTDKAARAFELATAAALGTRRKERAEKKAGVLDGVTRRWVNRKKRNTAIFVVFIVLVLGPLVGALLWAMVMHKFDWTPGAGEGY